MRTDPQPLSPDPPRRIDMALAVLAVVWMAEATVRLPAPGVLTALVYAAFSLRFVGAARELVDSAVARPALLAYPVICLLSTLWSPVPETTLIAAVQLAFTMLIGLHLGRVFGVAGLARVVAAGVGLTMAASAINLGEFLLPVWSWEGGFLGIYTNKNALGQRAVLMLLAAIYLCVTARSGARSLGWLLAFLGTAALLGLSLSATGILMGAGLSGTYLVLLALRRGALMRAAIGVVAVTATATLAAAVLLLGIDPVAIVFDAFGKSETLTGRTMLWQIAQEKIAARPVLGHGYMGFWTAPDFAQEARLITMLYGSSVSAFHNFVLEVLVMLGPLGLIAMALMIGDAAWRLTALPHGPGRNWALLSWSALVALSLLGSSLYRPHEISLLLIVALSAAAPARAAKHAPPAARSRQATARPTAM